MLGEEVEVLEILGVHELLHAKDRGFLESVEGPGLRGLRLAVQDARGSRVSELTSWPRHDGPRSP